MNHTAVHRVRSLDFSFDPWTWPFAEDNRAEIGTFFAEQQRLKPKLFNGQVLLMRDPRIEGDVLKGRYFQVDFATYMAWRDRRFPDEAVSSGFGLGALRGSDGVYLMGEMSPHTANAGRIYFPSGTADPSDIRGDRVDIAANIVREVFEETGLTPNDYESEDDFLCVFARPAIAIFRTLHLKAPASAIRERILANMKHEDDPEFSEIHLVRNARDLTPAMPGYVATFIRHVTNTI